ncbi:MAG: Uncharacterised protein [Bacteroidia bacterium]|nr:hypothetical protein [Bacteroidia bacterium]CAI8183764.1 MAG: Uncharacterised protein [Bacteroidia bacterium]
MKNILSILTICSIIACDSNTSGKVIARAFGNELYDTDIADLISDDASYEDSVFFTKEFINIWVSKQVLLNEAERILDAQEKDKSKELEAYKHDLLSYELINKLVRQEIDTTFSDEELELYYEDNKNEFELTQNIIKLIFYKVPLNSKNLDLLWSSFRANDQSIYPTLLSLSKRGGNYYENGNSWVFFDDILKEIPINTYNQEHYLNNHKYIRIIEGDFIYFIKINDFKTRSMLSPFVLEKRRIKEILLNKRQQELQRSIESNLLEKAYSNNHIQLF